MKYISTRGGVSESVFSATAIKEGLASDGGLFMPTHIPGVNIEFIAGLSSLSYPERAAKILSLFLTDYSYDELIEDTATAYSTENFDGHFAPVNHLDDDISIL